MPEGRHTPAVAIVGGGIAGLTAGVALARSGARVTVLEAGPGLGGRARSLVHEPTGDAVDLGPHVLLSAYRNVLALLDVLGTRERVLWQPRPELTVAYGADAIKTRLSEQLPPPFHVLPGVLRHPRVRPAHVADALSNARAVRAALCATERDLLELDGATAADALRELGVSEASANAVWSFIAESILNTPLSECSAGSLMRFCRFLLGSRPPRFGFADGGLGDLFAPARPMIERAGGRVVTGARVQELLGDADAVTGVRLHDGTELTADHVIAAVPADALAPLLRPEWLDRHRELRGVRELEPSPYVSAYLWFDRPLGGRVFWARAPAPEDLGCDFYDLSNIRRGAPGRPSVVAANIVYGERAAAMTDDDIVDRLAREIAEVVPTAAGARVRHRSVHRIPMAIHRPTPGFERRRLPALAPVTGLVLAGDWTATELPQSMESAARSGWIAADAVLAAEGRPASSFARDIPPLDGLAGLADARFSFRTRWDVAAPPERVFGALVDVAALPDWWPDFARVEVTDPGRADGLGLRADVALRGPLGTRLACAFHVAVAVRPRLVRVRATGHLDGTGTWIVAASPTGASVTYWWDVALQHPAIRWLSQPLRAAFRRSHDAAMERGRRGLQRRLEAMR